MQVRKRNGRLEDFDIGKIAKVIYKVRVESNQDKSLEECLKEAKKILNTINKKENTEIIDIEEIQDSIERYFLRRDEIEIFKNFTFYREKRRQERLDPWGNNDERQDAVLQQKYILNNETKKEFLDRISMGNEKLLKIFRKREAIWAGRILYAIGREGNISASNCYVLKDPEDSLEDIYRTDYEMARTYSYGGGCGVNISKLRPRGAKVNNSSSTTPGIMVFADKYSHTTLNTQQESRRGALMLVLNIDHPDVIDFATTKLDLNKVNGANISLAITDDFMKAYERDEMWELKYETPHEIIKKRIKARDLMKIISYGAHTVGDPGILFIDTVNNYHLLSEYPDIKYTATNPCGEQPLLPYGSCNLASINFNAFVKKPFTSQAFFDFERFEEVVEEMTKGLDDMLDKYGDRHPLQKQREHIINYREIGLGIMGLADMALSLQIAYGDSDFIKILDKIMSIMINKAMQTSSLIAKEKGSFPKYNYDLISKSKFFQEALTDETKEMVRKYGLRNSRLLSIAPAGSISNIIGVSSGIEPFFMLGYQRKFISLYNEEKKVWVYELTPQKLMKHLGVNNLDDLPDWAKVTSQNISFEDRAKVQSTVQKYVDTGISSTFNLPNEATTEDIERIFYNAWKSKFKGITVFRKNCKKIAILSDKKEDMDSNPAPKPTVIIEEEWFDKKTKDIRVFNTTIVIQDNNHNENKEKIDIEKCPECGSHLVKQDGCTKCSNNDCY